MSIWSREGNTVTLMPGNPLQPMDFTVPGDASSAAFPVVAALIVPGSDITLTNVNLNPTRTGIFDVLLAMGADLTITETGTEAGDPVGTIRARHSALKGVSVGGEMVVRMIDEFPIFMVAALFAEGRTTVRDAQELRVKETDRLAVMTAELSETGREHHRDRRRLRDRRRADAHRRDGRRSRRSPPVDEPVVAGLAAQGETTVLDARCASDSFPGYAETMASLGADVVVKDLR